jgi:iduronate 2-sulfatase
MGCISACALIFILFVPGVVSSWSVGTIGLGGDKETAKEKAPVSDRPNILFIIADDLRPELGIYGSSHVITPNINRLGERSIIFDRAYNQVPVCFPSRHSLLTGIRPDTLNIHTWIDRQHPYLNSIFNILVRESYYSSGIGKLFHHTRNSSKDFTDGRWEFGWYKYQNSEDRYLNATVAPDSVKPEQEFRDALIADYAVERMHYLAKKSRDTQRPFILSVGFKLPHTQYHIPRRFFDMYDHNR